MDRATLIRIVIIWAACAFEGYEAPPGPPSGCPVNSCSIDPECGARRKCCGATCKRCDCELQSQCACNASSISGTSCDCSSPVTGKDGKYCRCEGSGCNCRDIFGFGYSCTAYSDYLFGKFEQRRVNWQDTTVFTNTYNVDPDGVDTLDECKARCILPVNDCNILEWRRTPAGNPTSVTCRLYRMSNFLTDTVRILNNSNFDLHLRKCIDCTA